MTNSKPQILPAIRPQPMPLPNEAAVALADTGAAGTQGERMQSRFPLVRRATYTQPQTVGAVPMTTHPWSLVPRFTLLLLLAALAIAVWAPTVSAQEELSAENNEFFLFDPANDPSGSLTDTRPVDPGVGGFGVVARAGHVAGATVGRTDSVTYTDMMPYMFIEETMLFGDLKLNLANNGHLGGSAGLGLRQYFGGLDAVGGLMIAYDHDATRSANFEQLAISHEWLSQYFDIRTNIYLPFGRTQAITAVRLEPGSEQFTDFNITFQRRSFTSSAMRGGEQLYTIPVPGELAQSANLEATAGWYHYQAPGSEMVWGYKLRADADFFDRLAHTFVEFTGDGVFGNNIVFAADVNYWHDLEARPRVGQSQYNRMANWVRRNRTVVSDDSSFLNARELALKADGTPYVAYHVRRVPGEPDRAAPTGSIDNPFNFMQQGIDALPLGDIVFVHSDSVFDGNALPAGVVPNVVLRDDVLVLGEGVNLTLPVLGLESEITVPTANNPVGNVPLITNVTGDAVTFANRSRFSGFRINNVVDGTALQLNGVTSGRIDEVTIDGVSGVGGHGIAFTNANGTFSINGLQISNTTGDAFRVLGGTAAITVGRPPGSTGLQGAANVINNSSGFSTLVQDAAGSIFFRSMTINDTGGLGVAVRGTALGNSRANVTFDTVNLTDTNAAVARAAVEVLNHSGAVIFQQDLTIDNNNGIGIDINTLSPTGTFTSQGNILISNRNDIGIRMINFSEGGPIPGNAAVNQASRATFLGNVAVNAVVNPIALPVPTPNSPAVFFSSQAGAALFGQNLLINGSGADGIFVGNIADSAATTGRFTVNGLTQVQNAIGTSVNIANIADRDFIATFNGIQVSDRGDPTLPGGVGVRIQNFAGRGNFRGVTTINNENGVGAIGLDIVNASQAVAFSSVLVQDQVGPGPAVRAINNTNVAAPPDATISFGEIQVLNADGATGVLFAGNDDITVGTGTIDVINARGVDIQNNARHDVTFESVSATNADFGIIVANSPGRFEVTGNPANGPGQGSGGRISGMTVAGGFFQNTNIVRLAGQDYDGNFRGIAADQLLADFENVSARFELDTVRVSDSASDGVLLRDVVTTRIIDSEFDNNGRPTVQNHLEWGATFKVFDVNGDGDTTDAEDQLRYGLIVQNTRFADTGGAAIVPGNINGHAIYIHSGDTGFFAPARGNSIDEEVVMDFLFGATNPLQDDSLGNFVFSNRVNLSAMHLDWDGALVASITDSLFDMQAGNIGTPATGATAVFLNVDGEADVLFQRNNVIARGNFATGLDFNFNDATQLQISDNVRFDDQGNFIQQSGFEFQGFNSTAMNLTFNAANNQIAIDNNLIDYVNLGINGQAINFQRLVGPSTVSINNNLIRMLSNTAGLTEGIIFRRNEGLITLTGSVDNVVTATSTSFFNGIFVDFDVIPIGSTTGSILINGSPRP